MALVSGPKPLSVSSLAKTAFQEPRVSGRNRFQDLGRVSVPKPLSENGFGPKPVSQKGGGFRFRNRFQKTVSGRNRFHSFRVHFDLFRWKTAFRLIFSFCNMHSPHFSFSFISHHSFVCLVVYILQMHSTWAPNVTPLSQHLSLPIQWLCVLQTWLKPSCMPPLTWPLLCKACSV